MFGNQVVAIMAGEVWLREDSFNVASKEAVLFSVVDMMSVCSLKFCIPDYYYVIPVYLYEGMGMTTQHVH